MSGKTNLKLCILWEDELRKAAALLKAAHDAPEDAENYNDLARQAYAACQIALWGLSDEMHAVMLAASDIRPKPSDDA